MVHPAPVVRAVPGAALQTIAFVTGTSPGSGLVTVQRETRGEDEGGGGVESTTAARDRPCPTSRHRRNRGVVLACVCRCRGSASPRIEPRILDVIRPRPSGHRIRVDARVHSVGSHEHGTAMPIAVIRATTRADSITKPPRAPQVESASCALPSGRRRAPSGAVRALPRSPRRLEASTKPGAPSER